MLVFYFMEWVKVYYNGLETNVEVTKCGRVRKIKVNWYGNSSGSYKIKLGELDFSKLKLNTQGYKQITIQIKGSIQKSVGVHRLIASAFLGYQFENKHKLVVDHIDSDKLNNNLNNLRIVNQRENTTKDKWRIKKSGLPLGVCYYKSKNKYDSRIEINGKTIRLGYFNTIEEASYAYQEKLKTI